MNDEQTQDKQNLSGEVAELLKLYLINEEDITALRGYGKLVLPKMETFIERFYVWLKPQPEYDEFFADDETLSRVQQLSRNYWQEFFTHELNADYLVKRRYIGEVHARIGLPLPIYLAAMNKACTLFSADLYDGSLNAEEYLTAVRAIQKLLNIDMNLVIDSYNQISTYAAASQSRSLMEMSTPVTQIWEGVLFLPIVGIIDSKRAQEIMNAVLAKIAQTQASAFIMDISGVAVVDTAVANYLIKVTKATRLMGCESTISGLSPAIAQTIVELGIDVGSVKTTATMQDALAGAFVLVGVEFAS